VFDWLVNKLREGAGVLHCDALVVLVDPKIELSIQIYDIET
jgi:hypothetical protein